MLPARPDVIALQEKVHTLCYDAHKPEGLPYSLDAELKDFEITISLSQTRYIVLSCVTEHGRAEELDETRRMSLLRAPSSIIFGGHGGAFRFLGETRVA